MVFVGTNNWVRGIGGCWRHAPAQAQCWVQHHKHVHLCFSSLENTFRDTKRTQLFIYLESTADFAVREETDSWQEYDNRTRSILPSCEDVNAGHRREWGALLKKKATFLSNIWSSLWNSIGFTFKDWIQRWVTQVRPKSEATLSQTPAGGWLQ